MIKEENECLNNFGDILDSVGAVGDANIEEADDIHKAFSVLKRVVDNDSCEEGDDMFKIVIEHLREIRIDQDNRTNDILGILIGADDVIQFSSDKFHFVAEVFFAGLDKRKKGFKAFDHHSSLRLADIGQDIFQDRSYELFLEVQAAKFDDFFKMMHQEFSKIRICANQMCKDWDDKIKEVCKPRFESI